MIENSTAEKPRTGKNPISSTTPPRCELKWLWSFCEHPNWGRIRSDVLQGWTNECHLELTNSVNNNYLEMVKIHRSKVVFPSKIGVPFSGKQITFTYHCFDVGFSFPIDFLININLSRFKLKYILRLTTLRK